MGNSPLIVYNNNKLQQFLLIQLLLIQLIQQILLIQVILQILLKLLLLVLTRIWFNKCMSVLRDVYNAINIISVLNVLEFKMEIYKGNSQIVNVLKE